MTEPTALQKLLGTWTTDQAAAPTTPVPVNPPEAAVVIAKQTAPEVAGEPEPPTAEQLAAERAAVDKAAAVAAKAAADAEAAAVHAAAGTPKIRRTAPVVQRELDTALATIAELRASGESGGASAAQSDLEMLRKVASQQIDKDAATIVAMREEINSLEKLQGGAAQAGPVGADMSDRDLTELLTANGWTVRLTMHPGPGAPV